MEEFGPAPIAPDTQWVDAAPEAETHPKSDEAKPKRRGRPPKDPNAPKRTYTRRTSTKSIKDQIGGTLFLINLAFAFMPEPWRDDAMDEYEITALADALDEAARANPRIHKMLSAVLVNGGSAANLTMVAGIIVGRRLARHGIIDASFDDRLAIFLAAKSGNPDGAQTV